MIVLITGASHTGKTLLTQRLLEKYKYPYLSIDHLKMGLIRSGNTELTPTSDDKKLTEYLWPIVREIIKTAIENDQNLIVEGCYIPFDWEKDFSVAYFENIKFFCLVMSESYIRTHFNDIKQYASVIEKRGNDDDCTLESVLKDNGRILELAQQNKSNFILVDHDYKIEVDLQWQFPFHRVIKPVFSIFQKQVKTGGTMSNLWENGRYEPSHIVFRTVKRMCTNHNIDYLQFGWNHIISFDEMITLYTVLNPASLVKLRIQAVSIVTSVKDSIRERKWNSI